MNSDQVLEHFKRTDALLEGHFVLSSGLHSQNYLQCALALQYPSDAAQFGSAIAEHFVKADNLHSPPRRGVAAAAADGVVDGGQLDDIETVASPAIGGIVIGFATAQALEQTIHLDRT